MSMSSADIDQAAATLALAIRQFRKHGFRLVRDWQTDHDPQTDAAKVACLLLGLAARDEHLAQCARRAPGTNTAAERRTTRRAVEPRRHCW
jgi:hypothetical protein